MNKPIGGPEPKGTTLADPEIVAKNIAKQSTLTFKPGSKRSSLIEWNPARQAQVLDWHHRAKDYGSRKNARRRRRSAIRNRRERSSKRELNICRSAHRRRRDSTRWRQRPGEKRRGEQPFEAGVGRDDSISFGVSANRQEQLLKKHQESSRESTKRAAGVVSQ